MPQVLGEFQETVYHLHPRMILLEMGLFVLLLLLVVAIVLFLVTRPRG